MGRERSVTRLSTTGPPTHANASAVPSTHHPSPPERPNLAMLAVLVDCFDPPKPPDKTADPGRTSPEDEYGWFYNEAL